MITPSEKERFQTHGLLSCKDFLPAERVARARQAVLDRLAKEGIWREGAWYLQERPPLTYPVGGIELVKGLERRKEVVGLIGEEVFQAVSELLDGLLDGRATLPMDRVDGVLFTLPNATEWTLPHQHWHLDLPRLPEGGIPGVQIFTFLETVVPGGGGTLVVAGSHRLVDEKRHIRSQDVKKILKREPYFRDLLSSAEGDRLRFLQEPGRVGEVELQVVELCGEPGDVFFTDMRLLHTIAPNAAPAPRIMLTHRFLLESGHESAYHNPNKGDLP